MPRTTVGAVQKILMKDYDLDGLPSLEPFIATASALMDRIVTCAIDNGTPLTDVETELIERWLAAHFYACSDRPYVSRTTDKAGATFAGQTGMYLEATSYGQMAVTLDWSGCLSTLAAGGVTPVVGLDWLGKAPSEQTNYDDRD
jgi:hypothetical protein